MYYFLQGTVHCNGQASSAADLIVLQLCRVENKIEERRVKDN